MGLSDRWILCCRALAAPVRGANDLALINIERQSSYLRVLNDEPPSGHWAVLELPKLIKTPKR
jgi:hypothetical protein